jgi:hypothetical protein
MRQFHVREFQRGETPAAELKKKKKKERKKSKQFASREIPSSPRLGSTNWCAIMA